MSALADRVWFELAGGAGVLAVPVGSTEQHGPHLPLSTDTDIAVALAGRLARKVPGVLVAPALAYGASGEHQGFPGTLSIGHHAVELILIELARSATETFQRVLFVSAHGGNAKPVARAVRQLRVECRDVRAWSPALVWRGGDHAGRTETAVMLAARPGAVRMDDAAAGNVEPLGNLIGTMQAGGIAAVSPNGVLGDPAGATAAEGQRLLAGAGDELSAAVRAWPDDEVTWL